jgi:hypothetical protein
MCYKNCHKAIKINNYSYEATTVNQRRCVYNATVKIELKFQFRHSFKMNNKLMYNIAEDNGNLKSIYNKYKYIRDMNT